MIKLVTRNNCILMILFCLLMPSAYAESVSVALKLVKDEYAQGEPIAAKLIIDNQSEKDVRLTIQYPFWMGLEIEDHPKNAPEPGAGEFVAASISGSYTKILAGQTQEWLIVLNRYGIEGEGKHLVSWRFEATDWATDRQIRSSGDLMVVVDNQEMAEHTATTIAQEALEVKGTSADAAIEMLVWTKHPAVCSALERIALGDSTQAPDAVLGLGRNWGEPGVEASLLRIAEKGGVHAFHAVLQVLEEHKVRLSPETLQPILNQASERKKLVWLSSLDPGVIGEYRELVQHLSTSGNESVRERAMALLEE